jgi:hypothetical protein
MVRIFLANFREFGPIVLFKFFGDLPMLFKYANPLLLPTAREKPGYAPSGSVCE